MSISGRIPIVLTPESHLIPFIVQDFAYIPEGIQSGTDIRMTFPGLSMMHETGEKANSSFLADKCHPTILPS